MTFKSILIKKTLQYMIKNCFNIYKERIVIETSEDMSFSSHFPFICSLSLKKWPAPYSLTTDEINTAIIVNERINGIISHKYVGIFAIIMK